MPHPISENISRSFDIQHYRPGPLRSEVIKHFFDPTGKLAFVLAIIGIVIGGVELLLRRVWRKKTAVAVAAFVQDKPVAGSTYGVIQWLAVHAVTINTHSVGT